jgi:hypothetical protein
MFCFAVDSSDDILFKFKLIYDSRLERPLELLADNVINFENNELISTEFALIAELSSIDIAGIVSEMVVSNDELITSRL